jgi:hypothetical protein
VVQADVSSIERCIVRPPELHEFHASEEKDLEEAYRRMAGDPEQEREAEEWCEALIGDAADTD